MAATIFTPEQMRRIWDVVRAAEAARGSRVQTPNQSRTPYVVRRKVKITSTSQTSGRYPGTWYRWDDGTNALAAGDSCWVVDANGASLATGIYYDAELVEINGPAGDERPVFQANGAAGGSGTAKTIAIWTGTAPDPSTTLGDSIISQDASDTYADVSGGLNVLGGNHFTVSAAGATDGILDVYCSGGLTIFKAFSSTTAGPGVLEIDLHAPRAANGQTASIVIQATDQTGTVLDPTLSVVGTSGGFTAAYATVSGLVFKMGLYVSGSLSIASGNVSDFTEAAQDAVGGAFTDTSTIDLTYDDAGAAISADVKANSVAATYMHATATDVLFGRSTAGAGAGEEIACTALGRSALLLTDPGADTLLGWDDTDNLVKTFTLGAGLSYDHSTHTLSATSGTLTVGATAIASGTSGRILYDNAGVLGEVGTTGSGSVVLSTSPSLITPLLGTPTSGTLTNCTGLPDTSVSFTDNTTGDVSITKHGYAPKAPNDATKYLDGTGAYSTPAGSVSGPGSSTDRAIVTWNGAGGTTLRNNASATIASTGEITIEGTSTGAVASFKARDALTTSGVTGLLLTHNSSGTPGAGFGVTLSFALETTTTENTTAADDDVTWTTATHASRAARRSFYIYDTAAREALRIEASGSAAMIGFLGASAAVQQTGDAGTALVTFGLMSGTPTFAAANITGNLANTHIDAYACRVTNSADQSVANNTNTALTFDTERFDTAALHSTSSNTSRITVPTGGAGKWMIGGHIAFAGNTTGARYVGLRVNGTDYIAFQEAITTAATTTLGLCSVATLYALADGDYVELIAFQTSGGNLNVTASAKYSPEFWAHRVGN